MSFCEPNSSVLLSVIYNDLISLKLSVFIDIQELFIYSALTMYMQNFEGSF